MPDPFDAVRYVLIVYLEPVETPEVQILSEPNLWLSLQQLQELPRLHDVQVYRLGEQLLDWSDWSNRNG